MRNLLRDARILRKEFLLGALTLFGMNLFVYGVFGGLSTRDYHSIITRRVLMATVSIGVPSCFILKYIIVWRPLISKAMEELKKEEQNERVLRKYELLRKKFN
ncbi:hypothetical protein [Bacillus atrophaeus]|uniref:hypothetical protein n=1 Tax=Bacillus atrophaeus TaxID=1452 RepID=UPI002282F0DE|nr:hypothetical protein [Bacillus atrophaeus]MCY8837617.1 hypothetical protein [Bacillus atrophaeus]